MVTVAGEVVGRADNMDANEEARFNNV